MGAVIDFFKTIWSYWTRFANFVLESIFSIMLLIFYFTVILPFALIFILVDKESFEPGWKKINSGTISATELY